MKTILILFVSLFGTFKVFCQSNPTLKVRQDSVSVNKDLPCENKKFGSLEIINSTTEDFSVNYSSTAKIVIRFPKSPDSKQYNYIVLDREEKKTFNNLKEGTYEYEAKVFNSSFPKGWDNGLNSKVVSTGQIEIIKCEPTNLEIK